MKKLCVNSAVCDVRNVTEETIAAYEAIEINTPCMIATQESQALLLSHGAEINAAHVMQFDGDFQVSAINGPMSIAPGQTLPEEKVFLVVNGPVDIAAGSEEILNHYAGIAINGPVSCPESMTALLSRFHINGPVNAYPDGSIVLKKTTVLDRTFHLRAKEDAFYYAAKRVVALAPDIAFDKLVEKKVRFATRQLLVAESLAEAAVPLFDEKADIVILPDGCAYVKDDAVLDEALLKRYGGKLYVDGNVTIPPDSAPLLDRVTYLRATGDLLVCRSLKDRVLKMNLEYDELRITGGTLITGKRRAELDAGLLENAEDGVSVMDCGRVLLAEDITPEMIREKLVSIWDCRRVICASEEQRSAVKPLACDVGKIMTAAEEQAEDEEEAEDDSNTVYINTVNFAL